MDTGFGFGSWLLLMVLLSAAGFLAGAASVWKLDQGMVDRQTHHLKKLLADADKLLIDAMHKNEEAGETLFQANCLRSEHQAWAAKHARRRAGQTRRVGL